MTASSEKVFASQERVSGFPEKGADLRGSLGNFRGSPGEVPGKSGKLPGNPWISVKFLSERTSVEVAEKLSGKFGELPGKSGDFKFVSNEYPVNLFLSEEDFLRFFLCFAFSATAVQCF